jgi:hypothetical protein
VNRRTRPPSRRTIQAETVMLDLMEPVGAHGRHLDGRGLARRDEAGRKDTAWGVMYAHRHAVVTGAPS